MKKEIQIKGKKYKISTKIYLPDENVKEIIIACHGFGGDKESSAIKMLADTMVDYNIGLICFDFPGHGESEAEANELTIENCIDDINTVEEYIQKEFGDIPISIFATSFGAYISLINIAKNNKKYKNIILRSPAIQMGEIYENTLLREPVEEYKERGFTKLGYERSMEVPYAFLEQLKSNDLFEIFSNSEIPSINIIQGDLDDIAPIEDTIKFVSLNKDNIKLYIIDGADHRMKGPGELEKVMEYSKKIILEGE